MSWVNKIIDMSNKFPALATKQSVYDEVGSLGILIHQIAGALHDEILAQRAILEEILSWVKPSPTYSIDRLIVFRGQTLEGVDILQIKDNEQFDITLANPKDAKGQPSTIDPSKTIFKIDNPFATLGLTEGADGLTCNVKGAAVGSAQISGSVEDANNPGDVVLFTPLHLDVIAGDTVTIDVTTGPVSSQSAPPTPPTPPAAP